MVPKKERGERGLCMAHTVSMTTVQGNVQECMWHVADKPASRGQGSTRRGHCPFAPIALSR